MRVKDCFDISTSITNDLYDGIERSLIQSLRVYDRNFESLYSIVIVDTMCKLGYPDVTKLSWYLEKSHWPIGDYIQEYIKEVC